jgi:DNA-binding transcriptional ArsR family regulator
MVKYSSSSLDAVFSALSDPIRRAILARLARGESMVTELSEPFPVSLPAISKHVRVLERAGLLHRQIVGREHHCRLDAKALRQADAWLEHYRKFWEIRLEALEQHLASKRKKIQRRKRRYDNA